MWPHQRTIHNHKTQTVVDLEWIKLELNILWIAIKPEVTGTESKRNMARREEKRTSVFYKCRMKDPEVLKLAESEETKKLEHMSHNKPKCWMNKWSSIPMVSASIRKQRQIPATPQAGSFNENDKAVIFYNRLLNEAHETKIRAYKQDDHCFK